MHIKTFTKDEQIALRECVGALRALPFYQSDSFEEIFGNSRDEVESVHSSFPDWDLYDEATTGYDPSGDVVRNALVWMLNGQEEERAAMSACVSFPLTLIPYLYEKIQK